MTDKKELKKEELDKVSGGYDWTSDYYCQKCKQVTTPKTIMVTKNDFKRTQFEHEVCSICGGEYTWTCVYENPENNRI